VYLVPTATVNLFCPAVANNIAKVLLVILLEESNNTRALVAFVKQGVEA